MNRLHHIVIVLLLVTSPVRGQISKRQPQHETWYEQLFQHINPANTDFGSLWEQRKQALIGQAGNRYFQYSFAATVAIPVLLAVAFVQRISHRRALHIAAQSIADVLRHDEYARRAAREAIRRYNDHIEACNRLIETSDDRMPSSSDKERDVLPAELQHMKDELMALRVENQALREDAEKKARMVAEMSSRSKTARSAQIGMDFAPPDYVARINELERLLAAEQEKNKRLKGTAVDAHRA